MPPETEDEKKTPPAPAPAPAGKSQADLDYERVAASADKMIINRGGGIEAARAAIIKLLFDNKEQRVKMNELKARTVEDGAEVLRGKDLTAYQAFQKLDLTPAQLEEKLGLVSTLQDKVKGLETEKFVDQVAGLMGFSDSGRAVFAKLAKMYGLELKIDEVEVTQADGSKVKEKKPFARVASADGKAEFRAVDMYLDDELKEFRPALYADADADDSTGPSGTVDRHTPPERKVTPMPKQSSSQRPRDGERSESRAVKGVMDNKYAHASKDAK